MRYDNFSVYRVTAGDRVFAVIASSFERAVKAVFKELNAKTSENLPKPFDMRLVETPTGPLFYDGDASHLRGAGTEPQIFDAARLSAAERRAADALQACAKSAIAAAHMNEYLVGANKVIAELRELRAMIKLYMPTLSEPLLEFLSEYERLQV